MEHSARSRDRPGTKAAGAELEANLTAQADGIVAADFFHLDTALGQRLYAMAFLEHGTRRLHITQATAHPTGQWAVQQAREVTRALAENGRQVRFLLRDRDAKYTPSFDAVFTADDVNILLSAPRKPKMNAHCERVIGTIRREALDHILITNTSHATKILAEFADHYNQHGPHRSRGQLPPDATQQASPAVSIQNHRLLRTRVLGGAINEYRYTA
ncbi:MULTISPECIES: integrase core domain-containing protein [unclassified Streptomyces]|uniref:integrase core domain-containing protein n=1 Tax=unclassified Streptomyces TaxID=2593676 RepID=UPI0033E6FC42